MQHKFSIFGLVRKGQTNIFFFFFSFFRPKLQSLASRGVVEDYLIYVLKSISLFFFLFPYSRNEHVSGSGASKTLWYACSWYLLYLQHVYYGHGYWWRSRHRTHLRGYRGFILSQFAAFCVHNFGTVVIYLFWYNAPVTYIPTSPVATNEHILCSTW